MDPKLGFYVFAYTLAAQSSGIEPAPLQMPTTSAPTFIFTELPPATYKQLPAMLSDVNSYGQLFQAINDLGLPYEQKEEAFRRMVFNVMGRNCDDHTKNISFRLRQGHAWELAPAYDITFAHNPKGEWTSQHLMSVNGKFKDFVVDDLLAVADRFGIGSAKAVIDEVREAIKKWPSFGKDAGLKPALISASR